MVSVLREMFKAACIAPRVKELKHGGTEETEENRNGKFRALRMMTELDRSEGYRDFVYVIGEEAFT